MPKLAYSLGTPPPLKPVYWVGSSLKDLCACPDAPAVGRAARARRDGGPMKIIKSSGNVFADLGLPEAQERLLKAGLAAEIARTIAGRKLTQAAAAELMGIDQPKVSHLLHGRLAGFSTERLLTWLTALGRDVEIVVRRPSRRRAGRLRVRT